MAGRSMHKKGIHALVMLFLILSPLWASRISVKQTYSEDRTGHHFNQTNSAEVLGVFWTVQGIISASYAVYTTYQSYKEYDSEQSKLIDAKAQVKLFETTHGVLCGAVHTFVSSVLTAGKTFEEMARNPSCHKIDIDFLAKYLARVSGKPFGDQEEIQKAVQKICTDGFTKSDAMGLKLEETWWMGVAQGLGCKRESVDDFFLTQVWSGSSAKVQSASLLQRNELTSQLISLGLFVVVTHTDAFSAFKTFSPEGSSADVYEDFTTKSIESLRQLSCRLSYPMLLRSLRVEALERAWLALEFNRAGLELPRENLDVCKEPALTKECNYFMVCWKQQKCLIPIVDWWVPNTICPRATETNQGKQKDCFDQLVTDEERANDMSDSLDGRECKIEGSGFYRFCGSTGKKRVTSIVPTECFRWELWVPRRVNSHERMKRVAQYQSCWSPFDRLKDVSKKIQSFEKEKAECGWTIA